MQKRLHSYARKATSYQFRVLPFGVVNGPASFQRLMETIMRDFIGKTCCVYRDDIVYYFSSVTQHFAYLREILQKLQEAGLSVNLEKCVFGCSAMPYLGHIVGPRGLQMDPEKAQAIFEYPEPRHCRAIEQTSSEACQVGVDRAMSFGIYSLEGYADLRAHTTAR